MLRLLWVALALSLAGAGVAVADTADDFRQNCANCHTIGGGPLTGPDLKGVSARKDRDWLVRFILDPKAVIDSGDAYAQQILAESKGVVMPAVGGMTADRAAALLDLIEAESALEASRFKGVDIGAEPLTPQDLERGRALFEGTLPLSQGGPACVGCHTVAGQSGLGGGWLGPELTRVYERIEGRKALAAWLQAPPTATMQPLFADRPLSDEEVRGLIAYIEAAAAKGGTASTTGRVTFLLFGLSGCVGVLLIFGYVWRDRFRGVRRALVESSIRRVQQ